MTIAFASRHRGYQIGVISLYVTTVLFLVGNFSPHWLQYSRTQENVRFDKGIYFYRAVSAHSSSLCGCSNKVENGTFFSGGFFSRTTRGCGLGFHVDPASGGWVHACQAFEVISALALLVACIYTIRVNFCKPEAGTKTLYVEIATVAAGVLGFLGSIIFAGRMGGTVRGSDFYSFAWALFFTIFISIAIVVIGVVIAFFNRRQYENFT